MGPGMTAIIVEADEKSTRPVDDLVAAAGGHVRPQAAQRKFAQADRGSRSDEGRRASDACATINEAFEFESRNGKEEDHERTNQSIRREGSRRTAAS